jgi:hypothetical protein
VGCDDKGGGWRGGLWRRVCVTGHGGLGGRAPWWPQGLLGTRGLDCMLALERMERWGGGVRECLCSTYHGHAHAHTHTHTRTHAHTHTPPQGSTARLVSCAARGAGPAAGLKACEGSGRRHRAHINAANAAAAGLNMACVWCLCGGGG